MKTTLFQRLFCYSLVRKCENLERENENLGLDLTLAETKANSNANEVKRLTDELNKSKDHLNNQLEQQRQAHKQELIAADIQRKDVAKYLQSKIDELEKELHRLTSKENETASS